jgi:hypothetical protein
MPPRRYAQALIVLAATLFLAVVGANVIIDPQALFGTGLLPPTKNPNDRYQRFAELQTQNYDGLFLGSSRGVAFSMDELSARTGVKFARFAVALGSLTDDIAVLQYVLRTKAGKGERLRAVFLLLDPDSFGTPPRTNGSPQYALPPALSGESPGRFWWKNLTAIQFEAWASVISQIWRAQGRAERPDHPSLLQPLAARLLESVSLSAALAQGASGPTPTPPQALEQITSKIHFPPQLALLERFVALCRANGVQLIVATSPVHRLSVELYDPMDLQRVVERIADIVPVWDFTGEFWLTDRPDLWGDINHFHPEVAQRMMDRIFGRDLPPPWEHFGRLRTLNNP